MKRLVFTVTTDLNYDQRMIRICNSLASAGYHVTLVGRKQKNSIPPGQQNFSQKRINCFFQNGKSFYLEYNLRLFFFLLFKKTDLVCAIDLDTILPCLFVSQLRGIKRVYDAHELFCEMKEIVTRPAIYKIWKRVERFAVPKFSKGYTVNQIIAEEFQRMYGCEYAVIRNIASLKQLSIPEKKEKYVLYQGAVNEGRSFETLIPSFQQVDAPLLIAGDGNFLDQAKNLAMSLGLGHKVRFLGKLPPERLYEYTVNAWIGVTLFEKSGLSNYYSLANRFFDYLQASVPQLCVEFPAYVELNKTYPVAVLIKELDSNSLAVELNKLLTNHVLYQDLQNNCMKARLELNWQNEEKKLFSFYKTIFAS